MCCVLVPCPRCTKKTGPYFDVSNPCLVHMIMWKGGLYVKMFTSLPGVKIIFWNLSQLMTYSEVAWKISQLSWDSWGIKLLLLIDECDWITGLFPCDSLDHMKFASTCQFWVFIFVIYYWEKNFAVYDAFRGQHLQTRWAKTANVIKNDITVLRSNIIICDSCCFRSVSLWKLKRHWNCIAFFTIIVAAFLSECLKFLASNILEMWRSQNCKSRCHDPFEVIFHFFCSYHSFSLVPLVVNLRVIFEVSSFNRSWDMEGVPKFYDLW